MKPIRLLAAVLAIMFAMMTASLTVPHQAEAWNYQQCVDVNFQHRDCDRFTPTPTASPTATPTQCNSNNGRNCPSPTPVCDNGEHVGNPHCQTPTPTPTVTSTPTVTVTSTPTGTATPVVTQTPPPPEDTPPGESSYPGTGCIVGPYLVRLSYTVNDNREPRTVVVRGFQVANGGVQVAVPWSVIQQTFTQRCDATPSPTPSTPGNNQTVTTPTATPRPTLTPTTVVDVPTTATPPAQVTSTPPVTTQTILPPKTGNAGLLAAHGASSSGDLALLVTATILIVGSTAVLIRR